ncbi:two-component system sensor histidine kinase/response regulator, partial [Bacillus mycoides]|nr:two-component system sensor histidine kinase/response regulator [Bacillus mycoides]
YDWLFVAIRTLWMVIIISASFIKPSLIDASSWVLFSFAFVVYLVPLIAWCRNADWYLAVDAMAAGGLHLYLGYSAPELLWSFVLLVIN